MNAWYFGTDSYCCKKFELFKYKGHFNKCKYTTIRDDGGYNAFIQPEK